MRISRKALWVAALCLLGQFYILSTNPALAQSGGPGVSTDAGALFTVTKSGLYPAAERASLDTWVPPRVGPVDAETLEKMKSMPLPADFWMWQASADQDPAGSGGRVDPAPPLQNDFQGIPRTSSIPPDPILAVGETHIVELVNRTASIFRKSGTLETSITLATWFSNVSPPSHGPFDPKVIYDHHAERWVILALATDDSTESYYLVSVSDDSDPMGDWWNWKLDAALDGSTPSDNWADYPGLGFDDDEAVYITSNQIEYGVGFDYAKLRILKKAEIYWTGSGSVISWYDFWDWNDVNGHPAFTWKPAHVFGDPDPAADQYLAGIRHLVGGGASIVTVWAVHDAGTLVPSLTRHATVSVRPFSYPPDAPQPGNPAVWDSIDTGACAHMQDVQFRFGHLYCTFCERWDFGSGDEVCAIRYLKIDIVSKTAVIDKTYGKDYHAYYYPAIYTDNNRHIFIVFNRSSTDEYPGCRYTALYTGDTDTRSSQTLRDGEGNYEDLDAYGRNRWGDYSGIGVDPCDDLTIWMCSEYATASSTVWGTWIGATGHDCWPPETPMNLAASDSGCDAVTITWDDACTEEGYDVYRLDVGMIGSVDANETEYVDMTAEPCSVYTYWVQSINGCGPSSSSNMDTGIRLGIPDPPVNCLASDDICDHVKITWNTTTPYSCHEDGFTVYRFSTPIGTVYYPNTVYFDEGTPCAQGMYSVEAFNSCGTSARSNGDAGVRLRVPSPPTACQASDHNSLWVRVDWTDNASGPCNEDGFKVFRGPTLIGTTPPDETAYYDVGVDPCDNVYTYSVRATNICGDSPLCADDGVRPCPPVCPVCPTIFPPSPGKSRSDTLWIQVLVKSALWNWVPLPECAEIGVYDADLCVGGICWRGDTTEVVAWGDDPGTPEVDGFICGNPIRFKIIDHDENDSCWAEATFEGGDKFCDDDIVVVDLWCGVTGTEEDARMEWTDGVAQNFPNPFSPETVIEYELSQPGPVTVRVFNVEGELVRSLVGGMEQAGRHRVAWDGRNDAGEGMAPGIYFYRVETEQLQTMKKMVLMR